MWIPYYTKMPNKNKQNKTSAKKTGKKRNNNKATVPKGKLMQLVDTAVKGYNAKTNSFLGNIGQGAGNAISRIFGLGAYTVEENTLWPQAKNFSSRQVPHMQSNNESIVFRHREYLCDVNSSETFESVVYDLNPGLPSTFPYLKNIARAFQEYKFRGLVFEFKSTSASALNSINTALGTIMLATQYRADAAPFTNKQQMLNEMWAVDGKPCEDILLPVECSPDMTPIPIQYIRDGALSTGQDKALYDLGKVTVASVGSQATAVVGELWVSYEVELLKPQLSTVADGAVYVQRNKAIYPDGMCYDGYTAKDTIGGVTFNGVMITLAAGSAKGDYILTQWCKGASTACSPPEYVYTNADPIGYGDIGAHVLSGPYAGDTTTECMFTTAFRVINPTLPVTITTTGGTSPATPTEGRTVIVSVDNLT